MIISCGEALIDFLPAGCGNEIGYVPRPGGSPYNLSIALARLAVPSAYLGCISSDVFGDLLMTTLRNNNVDDRYVVRSDAPSTLAFIRIAGYDHPQFAFYNNQAADTQLGEKNLPPSFDTHVDALHFGSYALVTEPTGTTLLKLMRRESGKHFISLDPNVRLSVLGGDREAYVKRMEEMVGLSTLVKVSRRDLSWLYPDKSYADVAQDWLKRGPQLIVVTLKTEGAVAFRAGEDPVRATIKPIDVVDVIGAGDSFQAALLAILRQKNCLRTGDHLKKLSAQDLLDCLQFANRAAAIACRRSGGTDPPHLLDVAS